MKTLNRAEQNSADTWDLGSLFENHQAWDESLTLLIERIQEASKLKGTLQGGKTSFLSTMRWYEETSILAERLYNYAFLLYAGDASDNDNVRRYSLASQYLSQLSAAMAFFDPELLGIEDKVIDAYLQDDAFADYAIFIQKARRFKEHVLSEREERLMALQGEVGSVMRTTFGDLTNVDFNFGELEGKPLTQSSFSSFLMQDDRDLRKRAYKQFYAVYDKSKHAIARLYEGQVKQDIFRSKARGYESSRSMALFGDKVPLSVYDNLIQAVHEALPSLHRYYALRARLLGLDKLAHYDVYVPLVKGIKAHTSYERAVQIIGEALKPLGQDYVTTLTKGLTTDRWVDRYENTGKRSGAFSSGTYTSKPYILLNYKEDVLRDLFTVAHEGGHSMHSYYSARNNPYFHYDYTIFEAEVASTFNEQLVAKYMIETSSDSKTKAYILGKQIDDIVATLFRQTMFAEYEMITHQIAESNTPLTLELLREEYRKLLVAYFGPKVEFEEESDMEGLRIPHFYSPFYVYKYATGISAAIALSQKVLKGGEAERNDYLSFLSSGGSSYPIDSLCKAGVDMASVKPVQDALKTFENLLDQFEALL
ncbi:oligoendopeptidase F [Sphaerochaeta globosa]|uniref:Oligopeptidase F n=1 Tax=Sphaerochaeta globosa (strain ATCC BAA-1886 / DSM 22777 / Buddy) TaxID=158189 RepID=F0RYQ9_SPHGB|nr:oligoendopeptidase F [Sphaerochaeta globosa]ADY12902.1 oligoendopeptidase F [Sphaerochaeta globosa str. Buddy]